MKGKLPIADENRAKYGKPPTWEQIEGFINELGLNKYQFEKLYGIVPNHLAKVKGNERKLGGNYWHIFYEKIKMPYGTGFQGVKEYLYRINKKQNKIPKAYPKATPKTKETTQEANDRLNRII